VAVSEADDEINRDLECLRLASDFMRLSRDTLNPALRLHCVRMAEYWSDRANGDPSKDATSLNDMDK
jgi:hypothetical protein